MSLLIFGGDFGRVVNNFSQGERQHDASAVAHRASEQSSKPISPVLIRALWFARGLIHLEGLAESIQRSNGEVSANRLAVAAIEGAA